MRSVCSCLLGLAVLALTGCGGNHGQNASDATDPTEPKKAQPKLQTINLWLGSQELVTELALTGEQQRAGMMFRTNMPENAGMLFVFSMAHRASFWMRNTPLPLSAAYIDPDGVILEIHDLQPFNTNSVTAKSERIQYVLETNQGWFQRHNISVGTVVRTEQGTLAETFTFRSKP
jgi:uncharacterized membrane protein (UPF0127 family)